jgi:lipid-A-disaccharide synthase
MLRAAELMEQRYQFLLPVASTLDAKWLQAKIPEGADIRLVSNAREALTLARASVVASGTATVEAALAGNPFVVVYRVSPLSLAVGRRLVHVKHFAMPNLIAGKMIVPELIQDDFTAERVAERIKELLPDGAPRTKMMADLAAVSASLHGAAGNVSAADRAANAITAMISRRQQPMATARV